LDAAGKPLYIGMSIHIQKRVRSHFSGTTASSKRQILMRDMRSLKHELAGSEWMAAVMEDVRIRAHWPPLNRAQKQPRAYRSIVHYVDRQGRSRLAVRAQQGTRGALRTFHSEASARKWLHQQVQDHGLRFDLMGLGALVPEETVSVEDHEARFQEAMRAWKQATSGWFCERGRTPDERGFIAVREGHVVGYGWVEADDLHGDLTTQEGQDRLEALSFGLHPVAPSSTLDARLREEMASNLTWVEAT
jgi:DNA polymerase-3 subunit epsilon